MIVGLDSAVPPTPAQAQAAKAVGIAMWAGYLSEIPQRDGLYRPWTPAEIAVVKLVNPHPIVYTSGWDDPVAAKQDAARQGCRLCLDVERLIRDDGPWVQGWLDASGAGLYGTKAVHNGRRAAFHIAAWYPGRDPSVSWPGWPTADTNPCGWQWQNTHTEFGVGVDRSWLDDWFGGEEVVTQDEFNALVANNPFITDIAYRVLAIVENSATVAGGATAKGEANQLRAALDAIKASGGAAPTAGTINGTITATITPK